jgi:predicted dehydrogenase
VRILIAGLGSIGQRHARNLRTLLGDGVELLAYRQRRSSPLIHGDLSVDPAGDIERELGIRAFADLEEAIAEQPEAVFVTNPNHLHVPVALAAAEAGCHLFIEKPVSHTLEGVDRLIELLERNRLTCLVGYQLRFHPGFRLLQRLIHKRAVGSLLAARIIFGEYLPGWHPYEDYRKMHVSRSAQGGGVLLAQIHDLDLVYALFGLPGRVFALGGRRSSLEIDVEDVASVLLDCGGLPIHLQQDLLQRPRVRRYEVFGEAGTLVWDFYAGKVTVERPGGEVEVRRFELERDELFIEVLRHFFACVDGREEPIIDARAGADSLRMALAAKRSLATGAAVALP